MSDYGWNKEKASLNRQKHAVDLEEANEIFTGSQFLYFGEDTTEDYPERRFCAAGFTRTERFLFVVYEEEEQDWIEDEEHRLYRHIIHAKDFERSHVRHFSGADTRAELEALRKSCEGPRNGLGYVPPTRKTEKRAGAKGKKPRAARLR